jgi:hypothetical protein
VTWKTLRHPNVLPLIGVTMSEGHFAMISEWMVHGNINDFVKMHPNANRLELVSFHSKSHHLHFTFIDDQIPYLDGGRRQGIDLHP